VVASPIPRVQKKRGKKMSSMMTMSYGPMSVAALGEDLCSPARGKRGIKFGKTYSGESRIV
jgi:hypothetical protein